MVGLLDDTQGPSPVHEPGSKDPAKWVMDARPTRVASGLAAGFFGPGSSSDLARKKRRITLLFYPRCNMRKLL